MVAFEDALISFRSYITTRGNPPFEDGELEAWASAYKDFAFPELDEELFHRVVGALKEQFAVTLDTGHSIDDNSYEPWWEQFKASDNELAYWSRFGLFLRTRDYLAPQVVNRLDAETDHIVDLAGDPTKDGVWNRRGMVIGHVQSGKTQNYSAVICKAADAGYKVIILLAGITNTLRRQTQDRINEAFIGRRASRNQQLMSQPYGVGEIIGNPVPDAGTHLEGDFSASALTTALGFNIANRTQPIVFVCKKNVSTLRNLYDYFNTVSENTVDLSLLLIDDEADNASINTKADKNQITAINAGIRNILRKFQRSSYLGYTATPFANVFIDPEDETDFGSDDLFPANYIRTLEAPTNYMGADKIFGEDAPFFERMVVPVDDFSEELPLKHKNHHPVDKLPESLELAVIHFVLTKALRALRGDRNKHCTMMINVSRFNSVQAAVEGKIYELVERYREDLKLNANARNPSSKSILHKFKVEYENQFQKKITHDEYEYPDWAEVKSELFNGWVVRVRTVNMAGGALDYDNYKDEGLTIIAIGGLALSRGLTLEGLCTTYILRNAAAYDTLMQMGRWFGYRPNYEDLCRLYLPNEAIDHYQDTSEAINELREEVEFMASENLTPTQFGLKVRQSPHALRITAANKMRSSQELSVDIGYGGKTLQGHTVQLNNQTNKYNLEVAKRFLNELGAPDISGTYEIVDDTRLWVGISAEKILAVLDEFKFPGACKGLTKVGDRCFASDFIATKQRELNEWNVHLNNVVEEAPIEDRALQTDFLHQVFEGYRVLPRKRTGALLQENSTYKINQNRALGTADDAKAGLLKSEYARLVDKTPSASNSNFKDKNSFKPTLVIYFINPEDTNKAALPFTDCLVSLVIHFPDKRGLETSLKTYQVNKIYQQMEFNFDVDADDEDEISEILAAEG